MLRACIPAWDLFAHSHANVCPDANDQVQTDDYASACLWTGAAWTARRVPSLHGPPGLPWPDTRCALVPAHGQADRRPSGWILFQASLPAAWQAATRTPVQPVARAHPTALPSCLPGCTI